MGGHRGWREEAHVAGKLVGARGASALWPAYCCVPLSTRDVLVGGQALPLQLGCPAPLAHRAVVVREVTGVVVRPGLQDGDADLGLLKYSCGF